MTYLNLIFNVHLKMITNLMTKLFKFDQNNELNHTFDEKIQGCLVLPLAHYAQRFPRDFDLHSFQLDSNDVLVLISDGLPECVNHEGEMLDYEAVKDCIAANGRKTAQGIIDSLIDLGDDWMSGLMNDDDITLVVIKKK